MRLRMLILVDILALCFAVATLWLMYRALQQQAETRDGGAHGEPSFLEDTFADDELLLSEYD